MVQGGGRSALMMMIFGQETFKSDGTRIPTSSYTPPFILRHRPALSVTQWETITCSPDQTPPPQLLDIALAYSRV
jgi:hypothetical protein